MKEKSGRLPASRRDHTHDRNRGRSGPSPSVRGTPTPTRTNPPTQLTARELDAAIHSNGAGTSAESSPAGHRGVDQSGEQSGVIHSGYRPHPGIHRDWCEAGHRVDLIDGQRAVGSDEEIDPSQTLTVQRTERRNSHRPQCGSDVVVKLGWDIELARVVEILGVEVVPARGVRGHQAN